MISDCWGDEHVFASHFILVWTCVNSRVQGFWHIYFYRYNIYISSYCAYCVVLAPSRNGYCWVWNMLKNLKDAFSVTNRTLNSAFPAPKLANLMHPVMLIPTWGRIAFWNNSMGFFRFSSWRVAWSSETTEVPFKYIPPDVAGLAAIPSFGFGALIVGVMVTFAHLGRKTRMLNGQLPQGDLVEQLSDYPGGFSLVCWIFLVHSITRRVHRILTTQVGQDMYRLHHFVLKSLRCGLRRQRSTLSNFGLPYFFQATITFTTIKTA